jgi:hypothetical protein
MEITMPPRFHVDNLFRATLNACLERGDAMKWRIQSRDRQRVKLLAECTRSDLAEAEDVIATQWQWFSFGDWGNPTIVAFIASNSELTFSEWLQSQGQQITKDE